MRLTKNIEMMKKFSKIWIGLLLITLVVSSCDSLLDVDSERFVYPEKNLINTTSNATASMNGLFSGLNKLADRYVLLGELRGDLLDISEDADLYLKEINDFNFSSDNPYVDSKDYYSLINNCNYLIQTIDTSIVVHAEKILYREYAAAKAIRAWTYMQLALNFGSAIYMEKPILSIAEAKAEYPVLDFDALADKLIEDLVPWRNIEAPEGLSMGKDVISSELIFPVRFVLGDLYLWKGEYENAAREYYDLITDNYYFILEAYQSRWVVENNAFMTGYYNNWSTIFDFNEYENITFIAGSKEYGEGSLLDTLIQYRLDIYPSVPAVQNWESQTYYHSATVSKDGDMRGEPGSYYDLSNYSAYAGTPIENLKLIRKYINLSTETSKAIIVYRVGLLYLRYAEAVNRAGKPNLAFATIKYGLKASTLRVDSIVPPAEKYSTYVDSVGVLVSYVNFNDPYFDYNIGVHARGCGKFELAKDVIPALGSKEDSIDYVEDLIVNELALETAFEGNRFHDLMRVALHRKNPSYLADRVAEKHTNNKEEIRTKLQDVNNWYLPAE